MRGKLTGKTSTSGSQAGEDMYATQDYTNGDFQCPPSGLQSSSSNASQSDAGASNGNDEWGVPAFDAADQWTTPSGGDFLDSTNQVKLDEARSEACRHCGGEHMSRDCTQSRSNGYGGGERRHDTRNCFKCNKPGHISRDCPGGDGPSDRSFSGQSSYGERQAGRCSNCDGRGHRADQCPTPKQNDAGGYGNPPQRSSSQPQSEPVCHRCNGVGHYAHNCPQRVGYEADRGEPSGPYAHVVTTTEEEVVNRNNVGINFSRYKNIQVKVTDSKGNESNRFESKVLKRFEDANLDGALIEMIKKMSYGEPTPVQKHAIPMLAEGLDVMACAQTGSGKTAAFVLPIVNELIRLNLTRERGNPQRPFALILTPTRELTVQITKDAQHFCHKTEPKILVKECYGGTDMGTQIRNIRTGAHIIVGTTGRVQDFLNKDVINLCDLRYLVLDEADRMLDMGFSAAVRDILEHHSRNRNAPIQTVMFSATFPRSVQDLARNYLRPDFMKLDVGIVGTVNSDVQQYIEELSGLSSKKARLLELVSNDLNTNPKAKILVFVETKRIADTVASFLSEMKIKATSMHGDRLQDQRERALRDFQKNDCPVLVATSVAARGLDITGVTHVVNFDLPKAIDDYIHRVGRTGRVGNVGKATSFYDSGKDGAMRDSLRQSLIDGGQEPPLFLEMGY